MIGLMNSAVASSDRRYFLGMMCSVSKLGLVGVMAGGLLKTHSGDLRGFSGLFRSSTSQLALS